MYRRYDWLKLYKESSVAQNHTKKAEYDIAVCLLQEEHSCSIVSNIKNYV